MDNKYIIYNIRQYIENHSFSGFDPYDALNSPLNNFSLFKNKYIRIALMQFFRRSPFDLRKLFLIKPGINPKAIGLFLEGYCCLDSSSDIKEKIIILLEYLEKYKSEKCSGNGWGYNFDWQNMVFFIPKYTPTLVNSSFIGHALLDTWEIMGIQKALDLAIPIKDFIIKDLNRLEEDNTICFSYTPIDNYAVHNANLLGASLLYRISTYTKDSETRQVALASLAYSMKYQNDDGSWKYSEQHGSSWIDSFHTGFNLESIRRILKLNYASQYIHNYRKGVEYYANNFFRSDGAPQYYHNRLYPIDIHSPAEAIYFFSGEGVKYRDLAKRVLDWTLNNMYSKKGYFYFRKGKYLTNKISYMRWSQAWMFRALTQYYKNTNSQT